MSLQFNWIFRLEGEQKSQGQEDLVVAVVGVDAETRMLLSVPVDSKGADSRGQAKHVVRFALPSTTMEMWTSLATANPR